MDDERADPAVQARMAELDASIREKIGDSVSDEEVDPALADLLPLAPDDLFLEEDVEYEPFEGDAAMPEADDYTPEAYDKYLTAEVQLANMGTLQTGTVMRRKRDSDGNPVGRSHTNPLLDTREYEVELQDGATDTYMANNIAESMYLQVDEDGNSYSLLSEIVDHKSDGTAVRKDDGFKLTKDGQQRHRRITRGWKLLVSSKDGSTSWVPFKDLKESFPVQVVEYAMVNKIVEEPAFAWWAKHVLRKRDRIIKKVKSRYWE
jgi:hypothetical protein